MREEADTKPLLSPATAPTSSAVIASRSAVDGLFSKYHLPFLRQLVQRTQGDVQGIKLKLRGIVEERYPNLLDAADSVSSIHRTIGQLGEQAKGLEDRLEQAKLFAASTTSPSHYRGGPSIEAGKEAQNRFDLAARVYALREASFLHTEALQDEMYEKAVIWLNLAEQLDAHLLHEPRFSSSLKGVPYLDELRNKRQRDTKALHEHLSSLLVHPTLVIKDSHVLVRSLLLSDPSITLPDLLSMLLDKRAIALSQIPITSKSSDTGLSPSPWTKVVVDKITETISLWTHTVELASYFLEKDVLMDQEGLPTTASPLLSGIFHASSQDTITKDSSSFAPFAPWGMSLQWRAPSSPEVWSRAVRDGKEELTEWMKNSQDKLVQWMKSFLDLIQHHPDLSSIETGLSDALIDCISPTWDKRIGKWGMHVPALWDDICGPILMRRHTQLIGTAFAGLEQKAHATFSSLLASSDQAESIWQGPGSFATRSPDHDEDIQGLFTVSDALASMEAAVQSIIDDIDTWLSRTPPSYPDYLGQSATLWVWNLEDGANQVYESLLSSWSRMFTFLQENKGHTALGQLLLALHRQWSSLERLLALLSPLLKRDVDHEGFKTKLRTGSTIMYTKTVERTIQLHVDTLIRENESKSLDRRVVSSPCKDALAYLLDLSLTLHGSLEWMLEDEEMTQVVRNACKKQLDQQLPRLNKYCTSEKPGLLEKKNQAILSWVCRGQDDGLDPLDTLSQYLPEALREEKDGILWQCASMHHLLGPLSPFSTDEQAQRNFGGASSGPPLFSLAPQIPRLALLPMLPGDDSEEG
ncbi:hypothetical protein BJ684DRAFT_19446 [Piptocephalis cylindrospora]|uniref:Conserved oligomeric Golgi complex subunit 1 n=1 Tax=Piptocephalis cylindrospora TaxID=1907219 RepID=A0A4P9Y542_9FUNG|nr:hypothetical protein BJ684DRAFT_19446 [Piptocephalis cylindrospora]|eukprot:RKP14128.1 hypothetical protein BJ684DRAFT_19446 [Piptocephalis cylindrospora]